MYYNLGGKITVKSQDGCTGHVSELTVMNIGLTAVSSTRSRTFLLRLSEIRNMHQALRFDQFHDCLILHLQCFCSFPNICNNI